MHPLKNCAALIILIGVVSAQAQKISIPEDWQEIPTTSKAGGVISGGASPDGQKGALLSKMEIPQEEFSEMTDPLGELAHIVKEAFEETGYKTTAERESETTLGTIKILRSEPPGRPEVVETFIILSNNTCYTLRLIIINQEGEPSKDPVLAKILRSLKIPKEPVAKKKTME